VAGAALVELTTLPSACNLGVLLLSGKRTQERKGGKERCKKREENGRKWTRQEGSGER